VAHRISGCGRGAAVAARCWLAPRTSETERDSPREFLTGAVVLERGEAKLAQACLLQESTLGREHLDTATCKHELAMLHRDRGHYDRALALLLESYDIRRRKLAESSPETLANMRDISSVCRLLGKYDLAVKYGVDALENSERHLGPSHPGTLSAMNNLTQVYVEQDADERSCAIVHRYQRIWMIDT